MNNTIGQMKLLHEIQLLRGFSSQADVSISGSGQSLFEDLLQTTLSQANSVPTKQVEQSLGAIHNKINFNPQQAVLHPKVNNNPNLHNLNEIIQHAADTYHLPEKLIKSIIKHESNFKTNAVSRVGASGLMQLMPSTARMLGVTNIFDPVQNVMAGSKYLRSMLDKYDGNLELALAAYNAGPGNVDKYGGIPPFKETQAYINKVSSTFYS